MTDGETTSGMIESQGPKDKSSEIKHLLRSLTSTRKQVVLYGVDHPNTLGLVESLAESIGRFVKVFGNATCVFTKEEVIVNDECYPSTEGHEIFDRLRARGVMAITFVGTPPADQVREFLKFLSEKPREIRLEGNAGDYLRKHGVSRIVVTEAVYTGDDTDEDETDIQTVTDSASMDRVISATLDWLMRNDDEEEDLPRLQVTQMLADPDAAAKLIREAVTKKHASDRDATPGELADGVLHDLKDLAAPDPEAWDRVTPQIRKAISKLPKDMRPASGGFISDFDDIDIEGHNSSRSLEMGEVEAMILDLMDGGDDRHIDVSTPAPPPDLESLFNRTANGLIASWTEELQSTSLTKSSGGTLAALMVWEERASEHGRIARALASLMARAMEAEDTDSALEFAGTLATEANKQDAMTWRSVNARVALQSLETSVLRELVEKAFGTGSYKHRETASQLVEALPDLALNMLDLLGRYKTESFDESLKRGIAKSGQAACSALGRLLHEGSPTTQESALEILIEMGSISALREISAALRQTDEAFIAKSLGQLVGMNLPSVAEVCIEHLHHKSIEVRLASLHALGKLDDESVLPPVVRIAMRHAFGSNALREKVAAIAVLGHIGGESELEMLKRMAGRRPLFGRKKYESIRAAALSSVARIEERNQVCESDVSLAAA